MTRDTNRFARTSGTRPIAAAIAGTFGVALLATVGCGARDPQALSAQTLAAPVAQAGAPIVVSCEPNQRTLVRPVVVNGATVSQVECITSGTVPVATQPFAAPADPYRQPRALQPAVYDRAVHDRGDDLGDARVIPVSQPTTVARPIQARQVVYRDVPVRQTRSVKKSAIIIGSSAGAGAGVGAAIGGKKGALIGAAVGGGGAALWDQLTRRDR
jgi:hypothetical protein